MNRLRGMLTAALFCCFANLATAQCDQLFVDISTTCLTRCEANTWSVKYCNLGTTPADSVLLAVELDDYLDLQSTSIPIAGQIGNLVFFNIGVLQPGQCDTFSLSTFLDCEAVVGQSHCTNAYIFPADVCQPPSPDWDGSSVEVSAVCDGNSILLTITNVGAGDMQDSAQFIIIQDDLVVMHNTYELQSGQSTTITFPATGGTYHFEAEQTEGHPGFSYPSLTVEGCSPDTSFSIGYLPQFPEDDMNTFVDFTCLENTDTCVFNNKIAFPEGFTEEHCIDNRQSIEYQVNFQNITSEVLANLVVCDTLSPFLDISTLLPGASTYDYSVELPGDSVVKFRFDNINLPPGGTGFVKFTVFQKPDNPAGTVIYNQALVQWDSISLPTDSIFHTICDTVEKVVDVYVCSGEPYNGQVYEMDTSLSDVAHFGPFTTNIITNVHVVDTIPANLFVTICEGEAYILGDSVLTGPGVYQYLKSDTLTCDTLFTLTLSVDTTCNFCTAYAGLDTLICGFSYTLKGSPAPGKWKPLCFDVPGLVSFQSVNDSTSLVKVTECGSYLFTYTHFRVDTLMVYDTVSMSLVPKLDTCEAVDLVQVDFEDPSYTVRSTHADIAVQYNDYTCHEGGETACNVNTFDVMGTEPEALWKMAVKQYCEAHLLDPKPMGNVDQCVVENIDIQWQVSFSESPTDTACMPQGEIFSIDSTGILNSELYNILFGLANQIEDVCPALPESCFGDSLTVDCQPDTLLLYVPIRLGGHWTWFPSPGSQSDLNDTTFFDYGTHQLMHVILPNSHAYNAQFQVWELNDDGEWAFPDTTVSMTYQWQEDWIWDTLTYIGLSCTVSGTICGGSSGGTWVGLPGVVPPYDCPPFTIVFSGQNLVAEAPSPIQLSCEPPCVTLFGSASGNATGSLIYQWCDASGNAIGNGQSIVVCDEGTYKWKVSQGACMDSTEVQVLPPMLPMADAGPDQTLTCDLEQVTLQGNEATGFVTTFEWSGPGINAANHFDQNPIVNVPGVYVLTITAPNGCMDTDSVTVFQNYNAPEADAGNDAQFTCTTDSLMLLAAALPIGTPIEVKWSTTNGQILSGENTLTPTVGLAGIYYLEVALASSGCLAFDTVEVFGYEPLSFEIAATISCTNEPTGTLAVMNLEGGFPPYSYLLDNYSGQPDSFFVNVPMGEHFLLVLDSTGCGDSLIFTIEAIAPMPLLEYETEYTICGTTDTLLLDVTAAGLPGLEYYWSNGWEDSIVFINKHGTYSLEITNGCESQFFDFEIEDLFQKASLFDIPNVFSPNNDGINDIFLPVSQLEPQQFEMKIFSRWGGLVYQTNSWRGWDGELSGKPVPSDVYIYVLQAKLTDCKGEEWEYNRKGEVTVLR